MDGVLASLVILWTAAFGTDVHGHRVFGVVGDLGQSVPAPKRVVVGQAIEGSDGATAAVRTQSWNGEQNNIQVV